MDSLFHLNLNFLFVYQMQPRIFIPLMHDECHAWFHTNIIRQGAKVKYFFKKQQ
jgi:hypothetical protein